MQILLNILSVLTLVGVVVWACQRAYNLHVLETTLFPVQKHNYGTLVAAKRLRAAILKLTDELAEMELSELAEIECAQALEVIEETEWLDAQPWPNAGG